MTPKVSAEQIGTYFKQFENSLIPFNRVSEDIDFRVQVSYSGSTLFEFTSSSYTIILTASGDYRNQIIEAVDRSGIYDLEVEFNPIPIDDFKIDNRVIGLLVCYTVK